MRTEIDSEHIGGDFRVMCPEAVVLSCFPGVTVLLLTISPGEEFQVVVI